MQKSLGTTQAQALLFNALTGVYGPTNFTTRVNGPTLIDISKFKLESALTTAQLSGMNLDPSLGFPQAMGLLYNRGQYPFVYPKIYPGSVLNPVLAGNGTVTFQSKIAFQVPKSKDDPPDVWGSAYVWQLPWLIASQNATGELYQEKVSAAEVVTMLNLLTGMYNGADPTKADAVVDAAIAAVGKLSWDQTYRSDTTYDNIQKVAKAILDASN